MELIIDVHGGIRCIYAEVFPLHQLGTPLIRRASHVEPDEKGRWFADLSPMDGPRLGPFQQRSLALAAEHQWLRQNWLQAEE